MNETDFSNVCTHFVFSFKTWTDLIFLGQMDALYIYIHSLMEIMHLFIIHKLKVVET